MQIGKKGHIFLFFYNYFLEAAISGNISMIKILVNFKVIVHKGTYIL